MDFRLEVVAVPVSDVDRAKRFYLALGWREDADVTGGDGYRIVQLTPPGSPASIHLGTGVLSGPPGSAQGLFLAVDDLEAARRELLARGVQVGEAFHDVDGGLALRGDPGRRAPGPDPQGRSYATYALFADPDGNTWVLQEITTRLPGRV